MLYKVEFILIDKTLFSSDFPLLLFLNEFYKRVLSLLSIPLSRSLLMLFFTHKSKVILLVFLLRLDLFILVIDHFTSLLLRHCTNIYPLFTLLLFSQLNTFSMLFHLAIKFGMIGSLSCLFPFLVILDTCDSG